MSGSLGMILVPAASGVGAVLLAVTQQDRPLMAAAGLLVLAASIAVGLAMMVGSRTGTRRRTREQRERYLDYLEQVRTAAREGADLQRITAGLIHPRPSAVAGAAWHPARRWERRPGDADFLLLRAGLGVVPLDCRVTLQVDENDPLLAYDPVCLAAAQELTAAYEVLADQPICVPMDGAVLTVIGPVHRTRAVVRSMVAQLVWAHSPREVAILVCSNDRSGAWDWLKWLPHSLSSRQRDGPLPARMITPSVSQALELLTAEITEPVAGPVGEARRTVVVMDQRAGLSPSAADTAALFDAARAIGAGQIHLLQNRREEPSLVDIRLLVAGLVNPGPPDPAGPDNPDLVQFGTAERTWCRFDELDTADALLLARSFAPLRATDEVDTRSCSRSNQFDPLRFGDVAAIDPERSWRGRPAGDLLRVAIGTTTDGAALVLDLKESAQGGMGPHGLVVGATGSGKSELLRTLVTALAVAHPPETLALLLADFKGGATFSGLAALPHVTGMITNLEADATMVDRFRDALSGEVQRRQELLASAGKLTALDAYVELRRRRPELEAMPHLLVIVDEFSELLGARPDLADLFVTIGRIGRSIGIHLLLATQRLDTGRIRGLESHLSYRICLRTFSESESREAIGNPDAYHLPAEPGWAYLRADSPDHRLFRAMTVSRIYRPPQSHQVSTVGLILPYSCHNGTAARIAALDQSRLLGTPGLPIGYVTAAASGAEKRRDTVLDVAVERLTTLGHRSLLGQPARRVWLDPLPRSLILGELLSHQQGQKPSADGDLQQGLQLISDPVQPDRVIAVLGLIDIPARQRQELLEWDFSSGNGNLLVVGTGQSGKSTALSTLLVSLAVRHSPADLQVICVDFGGETLSPFVELPHVTAVTTRSEPELTGRVFARILGLLTEREALFRRRRFDSTAALRRARTVGDIDSNVPGDIVLILDGWAGMSESDAVPEGAIDEILRRGTGVGVHIVLTIASPSQLRSRLIGGFGGRIELRLSDSFDSSFDRQFAKSLPADTPGRALVTGRHYAQIALPWLDTERDDPAGVPGSKSEMHAHPAEKVIAAVRATWPGQSAPRIRTLPEQVSLTDLLALVVDGCTTHEVIIGLAEDDHRPVKHDLMGEHPHLVVYGDGRSGRTTVLRSLLAQLIGDGSSLGEPDVAIIDYRRGLSFDADTRLQRRDGEQREPVRIIATDPAQASAVCTSLAARLAQRINDPIDARNLNRPTGAGFAASHRAQQPEIVLLVDDYDLVGTRDGNPLLSLLPYLAQGADIGFHLILTRRAGGAARAQYESVLQTLGDLGTPILMLSGPPTEGRLAHGIVPQLLPPGRARLARRGAAPLMIQTAWVTADPAT